MEQNQIKLPSNKKFGYFFSLIFFLLSIYFFNLENQNLGYTFISISLIFLFVTLVKPNSLFFLNKLWMRLGFFLGTIINPIILGILFFGLITPYGLFIKLIGRDELNIKKLKKKTFWVIRSKHLQQINFKKQF